jgi:hypothetical protein
MRLQLNAVLAKGHRASATAVALAAMIVCSRVEAQVVQVDTAHTLFHEAPTRTNMTVYTPSLSLSVNPADWIGVRAGYEADVVSGASVATKAGPAYRSVNPGVDVVTTASVRDLRHSPHGALTLRKGDVTYSATYTYGTENDYRSHSIFVSARTEAYEHNTQLQIDYARNFDSVCTRRQAVNDTAAGFVALENANGCFADDPLRMTRPLAIDGFQASWTQAWTPVFMTQLAYTAQLLDGFQSNPYRSVVLAQGLKAQEHHPDNRARQSLTLRLNVFLRPVKAAVRVAGRLYRDTWDVTSGTAELEAEKYLVAGVRVAARGRFYMQSGAVFWSDDYTGGDPPLGPRGQYWTGDRELSPFLSGMAGLRVSYQVDPSKGRIMGLFSGMRTGSSLDVVQFHYDEFTLGGERIGNARAYVVGANLSAVF